MTSAELIEEINAKIEQLNKKLYTDNKTLDYFESFCESVPNNSVDDIPNINAYQFSVAYYKTVNPNLSIKEIEDYLYPLFAPINNLTSEEFYQLSHDIIKIFEDNGEELFLKMYHSKNYIINTIRASSLMKKSNYPIELIESVGRLGNLVFKKKLSTQNLLDMYDLHKKKDQTILKIIGCIFTIKTISELIERFQEKYDSKKDISILKGFKKELRRNIKNDNIFDIVNSINTYYCTLLKEEKSKTRKINKDIKAYQKFSEEFSNALKNSEVTNYTALINLLPQEDKKVKLEALKIIYLHNQEKYQQISTEYQQLTANTNVKYQALLKEYHLNPDDYDINIFTKYSLEELKELLSILTSLGIKNKDSLLIIFNDTTKDIILTIKKYFDQGVLNQKFLKEHPSIFCSQSPNYQNFYMNTKALEKENINPNIFSSSTKILLIDYSLFIRNIELLKKYNYLSYLKTTFNYNFFQNTNLAVKLDLFIELGLEKTLELDLGLLNENNLERLYILKNLNIQLPEIKEEIREILRNDKFPVPAEIIAEYLPDALNYRNLEELPDDIDLNTLKSTNRAYLINDIYISKNKVARTLKELETSTYPEATKLKMSIINNSILSNNDFDSLVAELTYKNYK